MMMLMTSKEGVQVRKNKINVGAILLMIYGALSFIAVYLSSRIASYQTTYDYNLDYYLYGYIYHNFFDEIHNILGITQINALVIMALITVCAILLCFGKRWGAIVLGGSMAVVSAFSAMPLAISTAATIFNALETSELWIIFALFLYVSFVTVGAVLGWLLYFIAGLLSVRADNKGRISILSIVAKVLSAWFVVLSSINQMIFVFIMFIWNSAAAGGLTFRYFFRQVFLSYGIAAVIAVASLVFLAVGILLSAKSLPDHKRPKLVDNHIDEYEAVALDEKLDEDYDEDFEEDTEAEADEELEDEAVAEVI